MVLPRLHRPSYYQNGSRKGASWYKYLLSKAIPHDDGFPDQMNVCDWTSKDIGKLPAEEQQAWWNAQFEELEALKQRNVYISQAKVTQSRTEVIPAGI